ncbi:MAG: hypothetical protein WCK58_00980 [Chloroflexota bacterium]
MRAMQRSERRTEFQKVHSARLVAADDADYLADCRRHAADNRSYAPREELNAASRAGQIIEIAARAWMATTAGSRNDRIVAADVLPWGARTYETRFFELDVVAGLAEPQAVLEVKWTSNPQVAARGAGQVHRAIDLLGHVHPGIRGAVLYVQADRGPVRAHPALEHVVDVGDGRLPWPDGRRVPIFRLPVELLVSYVPEGDRVILEAARDEADASVAARLERAAVREAGGTPEPARPGLRPERSDVIAYRDADQAPASPFAMLRELLDGTSRTAHSAQR